MIIESDIQKLFTTFNDIEYFDEPHKYFLNGEEFVSVTTLIGKYKDDFKEKYWSEKKSLEFNIPPYKIQRAWKFINQKGTEKGSIIHDYGENKLNNKIFKYPKEKIISLFGFDPIRKEYDITKKHVDNFIKISKNKLIPIKTELVIYDKDHKIAGMVDIIFYNVKEKELQIWDWKTNKDFTLNSEYKLLHELSTLEKSDLEIYSLQMELYKYIIEKNTGLKFGKSYLIWVSHRNDNFKIIEAKNRRFFVDMII